MAAPQTVSARLAEARKPAPDGATWPHCGHPKTPANTQRIGKAGPRCRLCRRKITREAVARFRGSRRE